MAGQQKQVGVPLYGLVLGVVLEVVAGVFAFLADALIVALVLCMVGLVLLGAVGDALRRN